MQTRLYVDGLTVSDLTEQLAHYGTVRSVEILTGPGARPLGSPSWTWHAPRRPRLSSGRYTAPP
jgi:hypothetical protein